VVSERLGTFAAYLAAANPRAVRITYSGRIADSNTALLRNAAVAGLLKRSAPQNVNVVNAMQIAADRGWTVDERHEPRSGYADTILIEIETEKGRTVVEGAPLLGAPRLLQVDGIYCEATLQGHLLCMKNDDVPGVIGHVGNVLGSNGVNIANFSLGRRETPPVPGKPAEAVAVVSTDIQVTEPVLRQLSANPAVRLARAIAL
jgi:D-3-phosphoglycerate dehydrogenase